MAKIKVRPHPGALSDLLKRKGMTQMDASKKTGVDRKTLLKIERGEEVKLETLQQVATKLQVTEEHFSRPPAAKVADDGDVLSALEPGNIMLRKLDPERLEELLKGAEDIRWKLNAPVRDDAARKFLEEFEDAVQKYWHDLIHEDVQDVNGKSPADSLRYQLGRVEMAKDIAARLERFAEQRLALLGADYLFWQCSAEGAPLEDGEWSVMKYRSSRTVLLSLEPPGTHSRRVEVFKGTLPPVFAPDVSMSVFVNGQRLPTLEEL